MEKENDAEIDSRLRDTLESALIISSTSGLQNLTDSMKTTITSGLSELKATICLKAYHFYQLNDFEPTDEIIPVMRQVVSVALEKGVL